MPISFNADEIFEIAQQIERNGARFYRKAADSIDQPGQARLLRELADMEDNHLRVFTEMRSRLTQGDNRPTVADPNDEAALYLQSVANGHVFDVTRDPSDFLTGLESTRDVLEQALEIEKDSVVFYVGIREQVPLNLGKNNMSGIIRQELGHVARLSAELARMPQ